MIINGGSRCNGKFFTNHLTNADQNEEVRIADVRGLAGKDNIKLFFTQMDALSKLCPKARNYFYHANINPQAHEKLSEEQWDRAAILLEEKLGLTDQPRFVVEHNKAGRVHRHIVWLRVNVDTGKVISDGNNYYKHQETSRQLEKEFGLEQVPSVHGRSPEDGPRPERKPEAWETFRGKESGVDVQAMKEEVSGLWAAHPEGRVFRKAIEARGYLLARGDRRGYCLIDQVGDIHSLARRLPNGVKAAHVREKLKSIPLETLPAAKDASRERKEQIKERGMEEGTRSGEELSVAEKEASRQKQETQKEETRVKNVLKEEDTRVKGVLKAEEERKAEYEAQVEKENELAEEMKAKHQQYESFRREMDRRAELAERDERGRDGSGPQRDKGGIRNAESRYSIALGDNYSMADPYTSLSKAAMAEHSSFMRDRERLTRDIAKEQNPEKRQKLELQRDIESAEYMAITSRRIGRMSEVTQGKNAPETVRQYERADQFKEQAQALRKQYREIGREQGQEQDKGESKEAASLPELGAVKEGNRKEEKREVAPVQEKQGQQEKGLMVEERNPAPQAGSQERLTDFVKGIPEQKEEKRISKEEAAKDPAARKEYYRQQTADKNRTAALKNISRNMKTGKNLSKDDIRHLSREDLKGIREGGDQHLKNMVKEHDLSQSQTRSRGR